MPSDPAGSVKLTPAELTAAKLAAAKLTAAKLAAAKLAAAKRASTLQVLFRCARLLNDHSLAQLQAATGHTVRPAHTRLFPHIDLEGTRPTELARRVGISKQAVGQLVAELEEMGTLERVPDPSDGRARLVRFATGPDGESVLFHGLSVLREVETGLEAELGPARWAQLRSALLELEAWAEAHVQEAASPG